MMTTAERLQTQSKNESADADIDLISQAMSRWRLLIGRRIISRVTIDKVAPELDISHFDVIEVVRRGAGEVTVGAIAEAMRVDPSRSSRLVAELVQNGMLQRAVSQEDARRTVVLLTEKSLGMMKEMQRIKRDIIEGCLTGWADDDVAQFSRLFSRFVDEFEGIARAREPGA
ncbi:MarR family winged helix-turn-helix transcriptional regulator [Agrobacterium sp. ES01]|uniref:MarR family winged helix-turn-helix transcriptional regulator n=1 Tax=Agrobacterium sp. ES01 TaxID=3420714 RepID=UPI003D105F0B